MKCLEPLSIIQIRRGGYKPELMEVPCGHCLACLSNRAGQWTFRLMQEWKCSDTASFVTLTYSDDNLTLIDGKPTVWKKDFQHFMKRLRNNLKRVHGREVKLRFYAVSEYGPSKMRPHMHIILFNYPFDLDIYEDVLLAWNLGYVTVSPLNEARVRYCAGYVNELSDYPEDVQRPWALMSRKPPIGDCYLTPAIQKYYNYSDHSFRSFVTDDSGVKIPMPRYYKNKVYSMDKCQLIGVKLNNYIYSEQRKRIDKYGGFFIQKAFSTPLLRIYLNMSENALDIQPHMMKTAV